MKKFYVLLLVMLYVADCMATSYYFSLTGNDNNTGTSAASPWQTINKLNTVTLVAGDIVLFQGGSTFTGSIYLETTDVGTPSQPIVITSYGTGRALINAGNDPGLYVENTAGIEVRQINFIGGAGSTSPGIFFYIDRTDINLEYLKVEDVDVSGFFDYGISIGASSSAGTKGFTNVLVNRVLAHDNRGGGIISYGGGSTTTNHNNIRVTNSKAYNNRGVPNATFNTGNGILLSAIDNSLIDSCEAYNNGADNNFTGGGPVGIWFSQAKNSIIQNSTSHENRTQTLDGGGFDLDNACQNCTIQYCYSYSNDGAGYLMANYGTDITFSGNIIRYNISENDGQKPDRAGIIIWGPVGGAGQIQNCQVYNNTIYIREYGVHVDDVNFLNVKFYNNIFYSPAGTIMVRGSVDTSRVQFLQNDYFSPAGTPVFNWNNNTYNSLAAWRAATAQEVRQTTNYGFSLDPLLTNPGGGREGYRLNANSPMVNAGLNLNNIGPRDFYGGQSLVGANQDIGAHEVQSILAFNLVSFMARNQGNQVVIDWDVNDEARIKSYLLESSSDGINFNSVHQASSARLLKNTYRFTEPLKDKTTYYRLKTFYMDGTFNFSQVISVRSANASITILNNIVSSSLIFRTDNEAPLTISLLNSAGVLLEKRKFERHQGLVNWPLTSFANGHYFLQVQSPDNKTETFRILKR